MASLRRCLVLCVLWLTSPLWALTNQQALDISVGESDARIAALNQAVADPDDRLLVFLNALANDSVKVKAPQVFVLTGNQAHDPVTGNPVELPADAEDAMLNNRLRGEIDSAIAALKLLAPDAAVRRSAIDALIKEPEAAKRSLIERALKQETIDSLKTQLNQALAAIDLGAQDPQVRRQAAQTLGQVARPEVQRLLNIEAHAPGARVRFAHRTEVWGGVTCRGLCIGQCIVAHGGRLLAVQDSHRTRLP